jgi:Fic family protein
MERAQFTSKAPGKLTQVTLPPHRKDWSFVPQTLPARWEFSTELWPLLAEAKEALGTLNGIGQTLPDYLLLLRPLQTREAIASSRIEGTYVTVEQLLLFELKPRDARSPNEQAADWMEVFNYNNAMECGCRMMQTLPICNRITKAMHKELMRGARGRDKAPGQFRKDQVLIGTNGRFIPPPAGEVGALMGNLDAYLNAKDDRLDPLVRAFLIHYQFEAIHPFVDGNGRVGRALLALMIYEWLGHDKPWLYMSTFYDKFKEEYVERLFRVSTDGAWKEWIEFCLRGVVLQAQDSIRRCKRFNKLRTEFHERIDSPTPRTHRLIDMLFTTPIIRISSVQERFKTAYQTANLDVQKLVKAKILAPVKGGYPKAFCSHEILEAAYGEVEYPEATGAG